MPQQDKASASSHAEPAAERFMGGSQIDFDIRFFGSILQRSPRYIDVLRCQGELLTRKGLHQQALVIDQRLVTLLPFDPVAHYNMACSLAQVGQPSEAIAALRTALEAGYDDIEYLQRDSDLNSLRDLPGYRDLLREYGSRCQ